MASHHQGEAKIERLMKIFLPNKFFAPFDIK